MKITGAILTTPKAYLVVESEVRGSSALALYTAQVCAVIAAAGGRIIASMGELRW